MVETALNKKIAEAHDQILDNDYALHEKLEYLIEGTHWNSTRAKKIVSELHDDWYRLQHNLHALFDKQETKA